MGRQQTHLTAGVPSSKSCCRETRWGLLGFRASRRSGEEGRGLEHLLRSDRMVPYLRACFPSWTAESRLPSRARVTLGKKQGRVKYFLSKAGDAASGVRGSS